MRELLTSQVQVQTPVTFLVHNTGMTTEGKIFLPSLCLCQKPSRADENSLWHAGADAQQGAWESTGTWMCHADVHPLLALNVASRREEEPWGQSLTLLFKFSSLVLRRGKESCCSINTQASTPNLSRESLSISPFFLSPKIWQWPRTSCATPYKW